MKKFSIIVNSIIFGVLLNLILPLLFEQIATDDEKDPPNGVTKLSFKGQFMHMMVRHNQVQLISSIIVAFIIGLSVYLGHTFDIVINVL